MKVSKYTIRISVLGLYVYLFMNFSRLLRLIHVGLVSMRGDEFATCPVVVSRDARKPRNHDHRKHRDCRRDHWPSPWVCHGRDYCRIVYKIAQWSSCCAKNWLMRCWRGYLSGARCRLFAYGPADDNATPEPRQFLPHLNPDWFYLSGTGLSRQSWKRGR